MSLLHVQIIGFGACEDRSMLPAILVSPLPLQLGKDSFCSSSFLSLDDVATSGC